jgi:hypothetical protein
MSAPDLDALYAEAVDEAIARAEDKAIDGFIRRRFRVEPVDDPSGLFTGMSSLAVAPAPAAGGNEPVTPTMPHLHHGPRGAASSDDAQFEAYMRTYFPQTRTP